MAHTTEPAKNSIVFWQEWSENDIPGEPAIVINNYEDNVELVQEGDTVLIAKHELKSFIKQLQKIDREHKEST